MLLNSPSVEPSYNPSSFLPTAAPSVIAGLGHRFSFNTGTAGDRISSDPSMTGTASTGVTYTNAVANLPAGTSNIIFQLGVSQLCSGITLEAWVTTTSTGTIFSFSDTQYGSGKGLSFGVTSNSRTGKFQIKFWSGSTVYVVSDSSTAFNGLVNAYVVLTVDYFGAGKLHVNNILIASCASSTAWPKLNNWNAVTLGSFKG